jgi:hypothetical protein
MMNVSTPKNWPTNGTLICKANWQAEILRCLKYVAAYEQKQIDNLQKHVDALAKYSANIELLEVDTEVTTAASKHPDTNTKVDKNAPTGA